MAEPLEALVARLVELATPEPGTTARRLPPERELGEALQMSRGALREQLAVLERLGFLHRTQGRGTSIDAPGDDFVRSWFTISRQLGYLSDDQFARSRMMLEETVAEAAAGLVTDEAVAVLRDDVDRMIAATLAGDHDAALEADVDFHSRLNAIVDDPIFRLMHEGFSHVLRETIRQRRLRAIEVEQPDERGVRRTDSVHYAVVDALAARDAEGARRAMRQHFEDWLQLEADDGAS
ncbi:FadR family transcriptional regulator [Plantibacter flavus]|jgi:DNA-binding FadR family transcriptional regulator|uniref:FadR/GntR family transcriptional regulator n=1 Tax=Plantibacter TaxID=190323 RepID=UPI0010C1BF23|nr:MULTISPECIES: FCD domain-containing protein [Plantibacter]MBD8535347.1 FadR family transcriptional regulator [Plantibacter sp. CFBP 13570]MDD9151930.1 FCD domain-containing protein [Plantibacter flavus]TKJ99154.1 FadR family transcriptional regulator [Plantibacter flavus]